MPALAPSSTCNRWSTERLFLGRGFQWDQRHTQRLFEARRPENQPLLQQGLLAGLLTSLIPQEAAPAGLGGDPAIHGVEPAESDIWMDISDRVGHTLVLGTTRVGKTRLAEVLISQDIRRGEVVIVFDPKGDIDLLRRVSLRWPGLRVLVFSMHDGAQLVRRAFEAGARGYLTKASAPDCLTQAVRALHAGERYLSPDLPAALLMRDPEQEAERLASLSPREFETFRLLAQGHSVAECARAISPGPKQSAGIPASANSAASVQQDNPAIVGSTPPAVHAARIAAISGASGARSSGGCAHTSDTSA